MVDAGEWEGEAEFRCFRETIRWRCMKVCEKNDIYEAVKPGIFVIKFEMMV
jgi:hypothetical protein